MKLALAVLACLATSNLGHPQAPTVESVTPSDQHYYDRWPGVWHLVDGERMDPLPTFIVRRGPGASFLEDWFLVIDGKREPSFGLRSWDPDTASWRLVWVADPDLFQVWEGIKLADGWYITRRFGEGANAFQSRQAWIFQGPDRLLRTIERSSDGGKSWLVRYRETYQRAE